MKLISNQINPHFTLLDSVHALGSLMAGSSHKKLNTFFKQKFKTQNLLLTNTARSALGLICDTVKPDKRKKIGLPAFICAVVATPFLERGYEIEWIDTDDNGVINVDDFKTKATNISLVVVPHVFGFLAPLKSVKDVCKAHGIFLVEDGAHAIRQFLPGFKPVADAQILSFGREKVISCVSGGALIWPENSPYHADFLALQSTLPKAPLTWSVQLALQPFIFSLSLPWWAAGGKIIPWLCRKLKLLPLAVTAAERSGHEDIPITQLGVAQKRILARQLQQHDVRMIHAQAMALAWQDVLSELEDQADFSIPANAFRARLVFKAPHYRQDLVEKLTQQKAPFHLSDWDGVPISPRGVKYKAFGYRPGQCPNAEYFARTYLTFPINVRTHKANIKAFAKYVQAP